MPILIFNGTVSGPYQKPCSAGPCEWCGTPLIARVDLDMAENAARDVRYIPAEAAAIVKATGESVSYSISTRMCRSCSDLHARIWSDGAAETRGEWESHEPPDFPLVAG